MKGALRYVALKTIIERNLLSSLYEAREYIPISTMARDMGAYFTTFNKKLKNPGLFTVKEVLQLAALFDIDPKMLFDMVVRDVEERKRKILDLPPTRSVPLPVRKNSGIQ